MKRYSTSVGLWAIITATTEREKILLLPLNNAELAQDDGVVWNVFGQDYVSLLPSFFLHDIVIVERCLTLLRGEICPVTSTYSTWENVEDLIFLPDGAPPHFVIVVYEWLNAHYPGRWMGRCGLHEWPARSPDVAP